MLSTTYEDLPHGALQFAAAGNFGGLAQGAGAASPVFGGREPDSVKQARERDLPVRYVQRDRDTKFTRTFDQELKDHKIKRIVNAFRSPNTNAFIERFIQSIGQECLDRFVIFGAQHVNYLYQEYLEYYHHERPHQSLDNEPIIKPKSRGRPKVEPEVVLPLSQLRCKERLGGLLKSYSLAA